LAASRLKLYLRSQLKELAKTPADQLVSKRYERFRKLGVFDEGTVEQI
jgi:acetyl-CoA carboxylase carboxyl transferase subunit alpha